MRAVLATIALTTVAWSACQIIGGCSDGTNGEVPSVGSGGDTPGPSLGVAVGAEPTPSPAPAPAPRPADGPEPTGALAPPSPSPDPAPTPAPERAQEPHETGETIDGVALTFYTCVGDSTGQYCGTMASGQTVHRGAAACGYAWNLGQQFRILGDPYPDTIYTCLDRGGGSNLWIDVWFYDVTEGRAWRNHLPQYVTVEMMP